MNVSAIGFEAYVRLFQGEVLQLGYIHAVLAKYSAGFTLQRLGRAVLILLNQSLRIIRYTG